MVYSMRSFGFVLPNSCNTGTSRRSVTDWQITINPEAWSDPHHYRL
jgi:hypothetical protein